VKLAFTGVRRFEEYGAEQWPSVRGFVAGH
jgi:hypothetical protein